jgi:hypothetical protein
MLQNKFKKVVLTMTGIISLFLISKNMRIILQIFIYLRDDVIF